MLASNMGGQFGDTTYTKVFVGGLAWETQKDTMKNYFQQFGDILEAVVITDKSSGRSKGYGFVTFREPEAAMKACVDAAPVIDGRRANCNLASLGLQRSKPSTPKHGGGGGGGRNYKIMSSFQTGFQGGVGPTFASAPSFHQYAIQQGIPYNVYEYPPYSSDYSYPMSYYGMYGGATGQQYLYYGAATAGIGGGMMSAAAASYYPYLHQFGEGNGGAAALDGGYGGGGLQFPQGQHHLFQYGNAAFGANGMYPQHYASPISLAPSPPLQSVCFAVPQA